MQDLRRLEACWCQAGEEEEEEGAGATAEEAPPQFQFFFTPGDASLLHAALPTTNIPLINRRRLRARACARSPLQDGSRALASRERDTRQLRRSKTTGLQKMQAQRYRDVQCH